MIEDEWIDKIIDGVDHLAAARSFAADYTKRETDNAKKLIRVRVEVAQVDAKPGAYPNQFDLDWFSGQWDIATEAQG